MRIIPPNTPLRAGLADGSRWRVVTVWLLGMRISNPYQVSAGIRSMTHPEAALCFRLGYPSKARRIGNSLIHCHKRRLLGASKASPKGRQSYWHSNESPCPQGSDRPRGKRAFDQAEDPIKRQGWPFGDIGAASRAEKTLFDSAPG